MIIIIPYILAKIHTASTNYLCMVPTACDTTVNEGLFYTIFSIRVTSVPFTRITNDVYLDARQPSINRVFSSMIPNQSRRIISQPNLLCINCNLFVTNVVSKLIFSTSITTTSASMLSLSTVLALLSKVCH